MTKLERKRLQCFFYMLMRGQIVSGKIEDILEPLEDLNNWWSDKEKDGYKYSAPPLEAYAKWLVDRFEQTEQPPKKKTKKK